MDVVAARDVQGIDGGAVSGRFDDEQDGVVVNGQLVTSVLIAGDDFATVGDFDTGDSGFVGIPHAVLVGIQKDDSGGLLRNCAAGDQGILTAAGSDQHQVAESGEGLAEG